MQHVHCKKTAFSLGKFDKIIWSCHHDGILKFKFVRIGERMDRQYPLLFTFGGGPSDETAKTEAPFLSRRGTIQIRPEAQGNGDVSFSSETFNTMQLSIFN